MSKEYEKLCSTRIKDSQWQPSIFIDIPVPQCISNLLPDCIDMKQPNKTNIVPVINPSVSKYLEVRPALTSVIKLIFKDLLIEFILYNISIFIKFNK